MLKLCYKENNQNMFKSAYLNRIYQDLLLKSGHEPEFLQTVKEFLASMDLIVESDPEIERLGIIERILEPERLIIFRVSWVDDQGKIQVNRGFRIQHNSAIGPYKGGIRFDKSVNCSIMKFLAFEQTFKNSLTGLPMGGGKGGSDFDPVGKSESEIMRFCQSFMSELYRHIGENTDVPAGDLGVGAREVGYMFGYYKKLRNEFTGVFTGKGLSFGGSLVRPQATGFGVCYFALEMLKNMRGDDFTGKRVIVTGSGNVGSFAAVKAKALGAKVVAMNDVSGMVFDPEGLDVDLVANLKANHHNLIDYKLSHPEVIFSDDLLEIWNIPGDIVLPCATQNEIRIGEAKKIVNNKVIMVCEGANMPTTIEATNYLMDHGVLFAPGKAANAGGVATSGLEMSQNSMRLFWTFAEVDSKLKDIMKNIFQNVYQTSIRIGQPGNLVIGANVAGFLKVYEAMKAQGVV